MTPDGSSKGRGASGKSGLLKLHSEPRGVAPAKRDAFEREMADWAREVRVLTAMWLVQGSNPACGLLWCGLRHQRWRRRKRLGCPLADASVCQVA